eukprot:TRINITY_DN6956_c0_g4_i1.p1 TRINITY_DN6956_c0_g4~~TRINITY_DN6956_c0_g4_i1.p1  ORF type:complete len:1052 (+),score=192.94 TRINITY_DN6956_c0_g4_i1:213-3158(+)
MAAFFYFCSKLLPPEQTSAVHRRLDSALGLGQVWDVGSAGDIYEFLTDVTRRHSSLQATDPTHWCEERFFSLRWDYTTSSVRPTCDSVALQPFAASRRLRATLADSDARKKEQLPFLRLLSEVNNTSDNVTSDSSTSDNETSDNITSASNASDNTTSANATLGLSNSSADVTSSQAPTAGPTTSRSTASSATATTELVTTARAAPTTTATTETTTTTIPLPSVGLSILFENVVYSLLSQNDTLSASFVSAIKSAVVTLIDGVVADRVKVALGPGSVRANVTVTPPDWMSTVMLSTALQGKISRIESALVTGILGIDGIQSVKTGPLSVSITGVETSESIPDCWDDDKAVSVALGRTTTCNETQDEVCSTDLGLAHCPSTCLLCGPFKYKLMKAFIGPQITVLPMVVYQTRFEEKSCNGFARKYMQQPINREQFFRPGLDGKRNGRLTTCIDREKQMKRDFAIEVPCENAPAGECVDGKYYDTPSRDFLGDTVYMQLLANSAVDIDRMKAIQWLDAQTGTVAMSFLVYTEGLEVFTVVSIFFTFDEAGNVEPKIEMSSWKELESEGRAIVIASAILAAAIGIFSIVHNTWSLRNVQTLKVADAYEIGARVWFVVVTLSVLAWRLARTSVSEQYERALEIQGNELYLTKASSKNVLDAFVDTAKLMHECAEELDTIHVLLLITVVMQLVQMLLFFHSHPRTAVLSATMQLAFERLCYLATLFIPFFVFMAFIAFWMFGFQLTTFANFGQALTSQLQMLYGDFLQAPGVPTLSDADGTMYWIHAVLFLVTVFMLMRFVFLAVVIDSFLETKAERPVVACSALFDVLDSVLSTLRWRRGSGTEFTHSFWGSYAWSSQDIFVEWLEMWPIGTVLTNEGLADFFGSKEIAADFQLYYANKTPGIIENGADRSSGSSSKATGSADFPAATPPVIRPKLDPDRVAKRVVHEVTSRLAERDLKDVDRFVTIGRIACAISREFRDAGLIPS